MVMLVLTESIKRYWKQLTAFAVLLLLLTVTYWKGCVRGHSLAVPKVSAVLSPLRSDESERILVNLPHNQITVQTHKTLQTLTGVRHADITVKTDGSVYVVAHPYGLTFEPGLGVFMGVGGPRIGPDLCWAYWHRLDVLAGIGFASHDRPVAVGYVGLGYSLPFKYISNTDIFVGYGTSQQFLIGLRIGF